MFLTDLFWPLCMMGFLASYFIGHLTNAVVNGEMPTYKKQAGGYICGVVEMIVVFSIAMHFDIIRWGH